MLLPSGDCAKGTLGIGGNEARRSREAEALEAKVMAMVATHLREADKMTRFLGKNVESRLDALEQRQVQLERRVSEFTNMQRQKPDTGPSSEKPGRKVAEDLQQPLQSSSRAKRTSRSERHLEAMDDGEEERQLRIATKEAELLEQRLQAAEATLGQQQQQQQQVHHPQKAERVDRNERSSAKAHIAAAESRQKAGTRETGDAALLAVQELEGHLQAEMKAIHKRCTGLQDTVDERVLLPLRDIEQRMDEQDQKVRQLISAGQECSSRVEEHEFRLGVARTKLEVHDQKISRLEAMRWQRESSGSFKQPSARDRAESWTSSSADLTTGMCH